jgi:toxin FitB
MIVVDTNVWSEATKAEPSPIVRQWARQNESKLWLTSVVLAELRAGAAMMPIGKRRSALETQFDALAQDYEDRLLLFDAQTSAFYAQVLESAKKAGKPIKTADAMIAAAALQHGMVLATRDLGDFAGAGVKLLNPWDS